MNGKASSGRIIALAGKGGVGKTTITSLMAGLLRDQGFRVLAVDADPPVSLTYALGAEPVRTLGELRMRLIEDPGEKRRLRDLPMAEVIRDELVMDVDGISLLVLGQPEAAGCFCGINELLKYGVESLVKSYDAALIDCEAGLEQINRRAISCLDTLVMISDPTLKGVRTAVHLRNIAARHGVMGSYRAGLVFNRVGPDLEDLEKAARDQGLDLWGRVPPDENVTLFDRLGRPTLNLPDDSPSRIAVREIMTGLGLLNRERARSRAAP
ncbi:MAG: AAA family ATPase [Pseudomonadota bacterium]